MTRRTSRRTFLKETALSGIGFWAAGGMALAESKSANDKLNVAFVGIGGMGGGNLDSIAKLGENVVAICDIDDQRLDKAADNHKNAAKFNDFREMLTKKEKDIDAVVVSTPDNCHAVASVMAMKLGKHCYCEKPLAFNIYETRMMRLLAAEKKLATSMGNRGTAEDGFRQGVEILRSGAIGDVTEVHVWTNRPDKYWKQGMDRPKDTPPIPKHVHWDLWLGPAAERPYHPGYHPHDWRAWQDFGTGAIGDMACHTANLPFMGLQLGFPTSVEAISSPMNKETYPHWSVVTFQFPKRGNLAPLKLLWYDGQKEGKRNLPPSDLVKDLKLADSGSLCIGSKGSLFSPDDNGKQQELYPKDRFADFKKPERTLPRGTGNHYKDWINACKGGEPAMANFDYAGRLTEFVLLGDVALRVGQKIEWNGEQMKATNCEKDAAPFIKRELREGWKL
jgi:predicted dehydrogenase